MKKLLSIIFSLSIALVAAISFSFIFEGGMISNAADSDYFLIEKEDDLITLSNQVNGVNDATYSGKPVRLENDITLTKPFTSIGTAEKPFKWTFDGNGKRIKNLTLTFSSDVNTQPSMYQGLFGVTNGATIQNLNISGFSAGEWTAQSELYMGTLVGKAINTKISKCEVDSITGEESFNFDISHKITYGGMVGWLSGSGSSIENSAVYLDTNINYSMVNVYTIKVGTIAGIVEDALLKKVVSFSNIDISKKTGVTNNTDVIFRVGGLIGEIPASSSVTKVKDCVYAGSINYNSSDFSSSSFGKVVGQTSGSASGISSVAYAYGGNVNVAFGNGAQPTEDKNVLCVPDSIVRIKSFYDDDSYSFDSPIDSERKSFAWNKDTGLWDFNGTWIIASVNDIQETQIRLQLFQTFTIKMRDPIDATGLLEMVEGPKQTEFSYGDPVTFKFKFQDEDDKIYYKLSAIYSGHDNPLVIDDFTLLEDGHTRQSTQKDVTISEEETETGLIFTLTIMASNLRAGEYFIELEPVPYDVYIKAGDNGFIRYSLETTLVKDKRRDNITKNQSIEVVAQGANQYAFKNWSLYYLDEEGELDYQGHKWTKQLSFEDEQYSFTQNPFTLLFGDGMFNQTLLLEANFVSDPLSLTLTFDYNMIERVEVTNSIGNNSVITISGSTVQLDKSEQVKIKIFVKKDSTLTDDGVVSSIKRWFKKETSAVNVTSSKDSENPNLTVFEFTFSTADINYESTSEFTLSIRATEKPPEKNNNTLWIIIGVVGGVVLLAAIGLTIWLVLRRKYTGGSKKDDYKQMYY